MVSPTLRRRVADQAGFQCGYCRTQERVSGIPLTLEHLVPKAKGGDDDERNLWLSCRLCNEAKGVLTEAPENEVGDVVPLFNPRTQKWAEHFAWDANGTRLLGKTPTGRATVMALDLNSELRMLARSLWVEAGWHPPQNDR